jgi:hypothetical protein
LCCRLFFDTPPSMNPFFLALFLQYQLYLTIVY